MMTAEAERGNLRAGYAKWTERNCAVARHSEPSMPRPSDLLDPAASLGRTAEEEMIIPVVSF
jgi:hypothetical protein